MTLNSLGEFAKLAYNELHCGTKAYGEIVAIN